LLPQRQVFQDQFPMAAERQRECADDHDEQLQHAVIVAGLGEKFNSDEFWRWSSVAAIEAACVTEAVVAWIYFFLTTQQSAFQARESEIVTFPQSC
jgi:hypothetical protein